MKKFVAIVFALCAAVAGCSNSNTPDGAPHSHGKAWVASGASSHGTTFRNGTVACTDCHEIDSYCVKCHFDPNQADVRVPAGLNWEHGTLPHHFPELEKACNTCHDVLRQYGLGPQPCHDCHGKVAAPHAFDQAWYISDGGPFHGTTTVPDCAQCHGPLDEFCTTCHFSDEGSRVPTGVAWTHAKRDHAGSDPNLKAFGVVCTTCHGITKQFTGQPPRTDCTNCHGFNLHAVSYQEAHKAAAKADLRPCRQCHDTYETLSDLPNFDGSVSGVACATCHPDAKAHPSPWYVGHRSVGSNWPTVCALCHNTQAATPAGPFPGAPSCFSTSVDSRGCHSGGPGTAPHALGRAWLDPTQTTFHGTNMGLFACVDCHSPLEEFCSTCHFGPDGSKVPPNVTWTHEAYPHVLAPELTSQQAVCNQCHTLMKSYTGSPTRTDCVNCHGTAPTHGASFQTAHRTTSNMDLIVCQQCHGLPGTPLFAGGVVAQPVCTTCHEAAKAHPKPWIIKGGASVSHKNAGNIPVSCALCHDTVIDGVGTTPVPGAPACRTSLCHPSGFMPHPTGRPWMDKNVNGFHGDAANADVASCQPCHGVDYRGGTSEVGCYDCHFGPQGWQSPTGLAHVDKLPITHKQFTSSASVCNLCHFTNRDYGNFSEDVTCTLACHGD